MRVTWRKEAAGSIGSEHHGLRPLGEHHQKPVQRTIEGLRARLEEIEKRSIVASQAKDDGGTAIHARGVEFPGGRRAGWGE